MEQESLIGFDAREMWLNLDELWPLKRRETFLLNQDAPKPLSTDCAVWPSVFILNKDLIIPREVIWRQRLWTDWRVLEQFLKDELGQLVNPYRTIAITQLLNTDLEKPLYDYPDLSSNFESQSWEFLGYDISEETLLSGLLNFGGDSAEMKFASEKYASHLNDHHLFARADHAFEYKEWCDTRDPGHGPFYVFGLYAVNKNSVDQYLNYSSNDLNLTNVEEPVQVQALFISSWE